MSEPAVPRFSVVIPAYNEARFLPRLLDSLETARASFRGTRDSLEIIVADNASTDDTAAVASLRGCRVVHVEKRSIAAARNGGARAARGEILCFVDADMRVHENTFNAIDHAIQRGGIIGGATGITPERWSIGFAFTYALMVPMVVILGMDTGVVFCRRNDFEAIGGYREDKLVAEDVAFLFDLRRRGKEKGQRLTRLRQAKAIASLRKFDEFGEWHYFGLILAGLKALARGELNSHSEFVDRCWYKPNR